MEPSLEPTQFAAAAPETLSLGAWLLESLAFPSSGLWPWWLGALALALVAVGFSVLLGRPFGVSGALARVLDPVREIENDRESARAARDLEAFARAMAAAAQRHFGDAAASAGSAATAAARGPEDASPARDTWVAQVVFVVSVVVGGLVSALAAGRFGVSSYGDTFERLVAGGPLGIAALAFGGVLVGFGTQMSGGCTSGHGLVGCARVQRPSLAATASFFGTGVLVSFLLAWGAS